MLVNGLARSIKINPTVDPIFGDNPKLLHDGSINGASYVKNSAGNSSYANLLILYCNRIDQTMTFDPAAGIAASKQASNNAKAKEALAVRTAETLSKETAANVDIEMLLILDLKHTTKHQRGS